MKQALILGGGSKWGSVFTKNLADNGYTVDLITSSTFTHDNVHTHSVDWISSNENTIRYITDQLKNKTYDLIFFNQNSGGGPNEQCFAPNQSYPIDHWHIQNWVNSMLPYVVVQELSNSITADTKVGWMLTGLIDGKDKAMWKYAGYASVKSTNLHIMRGFANQHKGIFFALNPFWFPEKEQEQDAETIRLLIEKLQAHDNGCTIDKNGNYWI
jgi:hypothetical protein